jgi:homoserine dehydrogenase
VGGFDACRKLSILLSLATGKQVNYEDVKTEGIEKICAEDFTFANALGFTLKQLVNGNICENGVEAITAPFLIPLSHPLATVSDAYNAVFIKGKTTGNVMFYGRGAGKLPTASAVVSNIIDATLGTHRPHVWTAEKVKIFPVVGYVRRKVVRILCENPDAVKNAVKGAVSLEKFPNQLAWLTPPESESQTSNSLEKLKTIQGFKKVERVLRVYDAE